MTTPVLSLLPNGRQQFLDANNVPLVSGTVETYLPGTLTLVDTWADENGVTVNTHPITLDAQGSCIIWATGSIRQIVKDALGNQIWDQITNPPVAAGTALLVLNNLDDLNNTSTARTNLGLGTSATLNTGTSGATVPRLDQANTWAAAQTFSAAATFSAGGNLTPGANPTATALGYLGMPQDAQSLAYTLAIGDAGKEVFFSGSVACTIPPNASVAFPIGTIIQATWDQTYTGTLVAGAGVTLRAPVGNLTGTRTITGPGSITIKQEKTNEWWVFGAINVT